MTDNVYQAPKAQLVEEEEVRPFYVVSLKKFWVLYLGTFGLYQLYWFYKNWDLQRETTGIKIWPIPRAIFSIFFTHSLFRRVNASLNEKYPDSNWKNHGFLATGIVLLGLFEYLFDKAIINAFGELVSMFTTILTIPLMAWMFSIVQEKANLVCGSPEGVENSKFTPANIAWLVLGFVIWVLMFFAIIEMVYPDMITDLLVFGN